MAGFPLAFDQDLDDRLHACVLGAYEAPESPFARPNNGIVVSSPEFDHPAWSLRDGVGAPHRPLDQNRGVIDSFLTRLRGYFSGSSFTVARHPRTAFGDFLWHDAAEVDSLYRHCLRGWETYTSRCSPENYVRVRAALLSLTQAVAVRSHVAEEALLFGVSPGHTVMRYAQAVYFLQPPSEMTIADPLLMRGADVLYPYVLDQSKGPVSPFATPSSPFSLSGFRRGHPIHLLGDDARERGFSLVGRLEPIRAFAEASEFHDAQLAESLRGATGSCYRTIAEGEARLLGIVRRDLSTTVSALEQNSGPVYERALRANLARATMIGTPRTNLANQAILFARSHAEAVVFYFRGMAQFLERNPRSLGIRGGVVGGLVSGICLAVGIKNPQPFQGINENQTELCFT